MKTILTLTILLLTGIQSLSAQTQNTQACKTFIAEGKAYQNTLLVGKVDATLAFYKENIATHCGSIVAKIQYETNFVPKLMLKETASTVYGCKTSIKIAQNYQGNENFDARVMDAHKENIADNCGTLVAEVKSAFCLFDMIDSTSAEKLKTLCVAAIKDAHTAKSITRDTKALAIHKSNIIEKCGNLQASL